MRARPHDLPRRLSDQRAREIPEARAREKSAQILLLYRRSDGDQVKPGFASAGEKLKQISVVNESVRPPVQPALVTGVQEE